MNVIPRPYPLVHGIKDQAILYPCFRFADVKESVAHIAVKLGFIDSPRLESPYVFHFENEHANLYIMTTPALFDAERLCYALRYVFSSCASSTSRKPAQRPVISQWHFHPLDLYLELFEALKSQPAQKKLEAADSPAGLLPQHNSFLDSLTYATAKKREEEINLCSVDMALLMALEVNDFGFPTFSEITSLSFWGVSSNYIYELADYGYTHFDMGDIGLIWRSKVPIGYLKGFAAAGYNRFPAEAYEMLYQHDVAPEFVQDLARAGLVDLTPEELIHRYRRQRETRALLPQPGIDRAFHGA